MKRWVIFSFFFGMIIVTGGVLFATTNAHQFQTSASTSEYVCGDNVVIPGELDYAPSCHHVFDPAHWAMGRGDAVGSCWQNLCCGDDSGEYFIQARCPGTNGPLYACCNNPQDKIDARGRCVASCPLIKVQQQNSVF